MHLVKKQPQRNILVPCWEFDYGQLGFVRLFFWLKEFAGLQTVRKGVKNLFLWTCLNPRSTQFVKILFFREKKYIGCSESQELAKIFSRTKNQGYLLNFLLFCFLLLFCKIFELFFYFSQFRIVYFRTFWINW